VLAVVEVTAKALQRFKTLTVDLAINAAKKTLRTEALTKAARRMAADAAKIPVGNSTVGEVMANSMERLDSYFDELLNLGRPVEALEDFGVYATENLANVIKRDGFVELGLKENQDALREMVQIMDLTKSDFHDFLNQFRLADGSLDRNSLLDALKQSYNAPPGQKPVWRVKIETGKAFDEAQKSVYLHNQLYVLKKNANGKSKYWILDSFETRTAPPQIVSRKYTQLSQVREETGIGYLEEFVEKYPPRTKIANVPSTPAGLVGGELEGTMYLEVPVQTGTPPVPQSVLQRANDLNIKIRDINGTIYNP